MRSSSLASLIGLALVGAGCGCPHRGAGPLVSDVGKGEAAPLDFGDVPLGQTKTLALTLSNSGAGQLSLGAVSVTGAAAGDYTVHPGLPKSLAAAQRVSVQVDFTPSAAGARAATAQIQTDVAPIEVPLTGVGIDVAICLQPTSLDFGPTQVLGTPKLLTVTITSCGKSPANLTFGALAGPQPGDFAASGASATTLLPGQSLGVAVSYSPAAIGASQATLPIELCAGCSTIDVPLSGVGVDGVLAFAPSPGVFGAVPVGQTSTLPLTATNRGAEPLVLAGLSLSAGAFALSGAPALPVTLAPSQNVAFSVIYSPSGAAGGDQAVLTGTFTVADPAVLPRTASDGISGNQSAPPCSLTLSPRTLGFGNVAPNHPLTEQVTLSNAGVADCQISSVAFARGTSPDYSLPGSQPTAFSVPAGGSVGLSVTFEAANATAPLLPRGALTFSTNDVALSTVTVPLTAFVNTVCSQASELIYTIESDGTFASFNPTTLTFTNIGTLSCPAQAGASPFSMAVDQTAVAWVVYTSGELFQVDTATAACQATSYVVDQQGVKTFGMSFVSQSNGQDTLFVAGSGSQWQSSTDLATIAFPSLALSTIAPVTIGFGELAGTGDGELWDFIPGFDGTSGVTTLAQLDPATANVLSSWQFPQITASGGFATKFYGGAFWIFLGSSVYEVQRATGALSTPIPNSGRDIVGAGVSTCAPVQ
ncbi:MAG: choice-of-anchor D domain-containing protein [Deltaproteobacteria bacterium]